MALERNKLSRMFSANKFTITLFFVLFILCRATFIDFEPYTLVKLNKLTGFYSLNNQPFSNISPNFADNSLRYHKEEFRMEVF